MGLSRKSRQSGFGPCERSSKSRLVCSSLKGPKGSGVFLVPTLAKLRSFVPSLISLFLVSREEAEGAHKSSSSDLHDSDVHLLPCPSEAPHAEVVMPRGECQAAVSKTLAEVQTA